jgi:hypothetical protein
MQAVVIAGGYEITPVKRHFRRRCREDACSGLGFDEPVLDVDSRRPRWFRDSTPPTM